jgi:hypothetical protein
MRLSLVYPALIVLALAGLASAPASAEVGDMTTHHYATCSCAFGYSGRACAIAVACTNEGGRCAGSCHGDRQSTPALRVRG